MNILTHNGDFHADELFAIALLKHAFGEVDITRTRHKEFINNFDLWNKIP